MNIPKTNKQTLWSSRINAWKDSPLSQIAYCKENSLSYSAFGYWRTRLKKVTLRSSTSSKITDFTAIKIKPTLKPKAHFLLKINDRHSIEMQAGFDESLLGDLIRVIEGAG